MTSEAQDAPPLPVTESDDKEFMATLAKGLGVLALFGRERPSMTLSQVAGEAGLSRATARRILPVLDRKSVV